MDCTTLNKGFGLNMIKVMFNKQFGKEFMKGVTSVTIIDYSDAPQQTRMALRKELDAFTPLLQEYNLGKEKEFAQNDYMRSFASPIDGQTKTMHAGEVVVEMVDSIHHGENRGAEPVVLYMFYISQKGLPLSVPHPEIPME